MPSSSRSPPPTASFPGVWTSPCRRTLPIGGPRPTSSRWRSERYAPSRLSSWLPPKRTNGGKPDEAARPRDDGLPIFRQLSGGAVTSTEDTGEVRRQLSRAWRAVGVRLLEEGYEPGDV